MKICFENIGKKYSQKGRMVVNDISLTINSGLYGFLGKNGAGKSTLLKMLATILTPTTGEIYFDDKKLSKNGQEFRSRLGYLPQETRLQPQLNIVEFLDYMAMLKGINNKKERLAEIDRCIHMVGLEGETKKKLGSYSGGMLRRAGIAQAFLGNPDCIIVDEPTSGLDPVERIYFRNLLSRYANTMGKDKTIIFSTHILEDAESLCENLMILDEGSLLYDGTIIDLTTQLHGKVWEANISETHLANMQRLLDDVIKNAVVSNIRHLSNGISVRYISEQMCIENSVNTPVTLEDAYIWKTGGVSATVRK